MTKAIHLLSLALASGAATARTIKVKVANGGLNFDPDVIRAEPGDEVAFYFTRGSHDVTLGEFDNACQPADNAFWSGTINLPEGTQGSAVFTIPIEDTNPKWIYCSYRRHCQNGMVGVINPPSEGDQNIDAFKSRAAEAPASHRPTSINGGTLNVMGDVDIPGHDEDGESQAPSGTGDDSIPTATLIPPSTTDGPPQTTGSDSPAPTFTGAAAPAQGNGALGAVMAGLAVGAAWFGLI
ncbi:hypothetical protein D8B26_002441 [Coccidioides posadasii str. Silveira]|uniref:Uncharacterized protein n=3 Tax=Coccidioides posadasii TaxID=199306 RepID=E9DHG9_COCPS|nr:hypothetical protein CPC735_056090 [Coccidioides posadasii C735 delta SOWgp]EER24239.1 hypothetical protein CPC735_056090 [Coccidioides posadasii C735 delta SOWgp]EFW14194.1 conserved hypothetical protein [Coccidioides posadasii str. Silveira]KMM65872.1 hypothetical protein CPAG_02213 [Coccidioides posadasii RMSCC 3488]QVM07750.1 hypothetical protein D8B26_002441 [Coccidioides posadasii str. Silveira]|eukprot:XP_003066384.1 hypothetical protein CPC735_056090 [Coccidioides posadasii C735 delta SOWgp]